MLLPLLAALALQAPPAARPDPQTDTTVAVRAGSKIVVKNFAGIVEVRTWQRNAVRVVATHSRRDRVKITAGETHVAISSHSTHGPPMTVDYQLTVPASSDINVEGTYIDIDIDGARGQVSAQTVNGGITVRGGSDFVSLKNVQGAVSLEGAHGRIEVSSVNKEIRLADITGTITAETVNGFIDMRRIDSDDVEAVTTNGRIVYDGTIRDRGRYRMASHNGGISVTVAERTNATVNVITYQGSFGTDFPIETQLGGKDSQGSRRRVNFTLGTGSARLDLESFQGRIVLRRPSETGRDR
jgi:DUF4097 and DUF4098 domain-containing protein YvlB